MGSDVAGRRPVLDVCARLRRAYNGETVQVDDQVEVCLEELAERGADAGEVFKDNSLSAWKPNVVRKVCEGERLVELAAKGIRVWSLSGEYDLTTADGRRHFREAMVAAAGESDKIINHQAKAAVLLNDLDAFEAYFQCAVEGVAQLGSKQRQREIEIAWRRACANWPGEQRVQALAEQFRPAIGQKPED